MVIQRDGLIQASLVGASAGGMGAAAALLIASGFNSGDVFAFSGAVVGAAATIAGAVWLADRNDRIAFRRERGLLHTECAEMAILTRECGRLLPEPMVSPRPEPFASIADKLIARCGEAKAILREAADRAEQLDFRQRVRIVRAEFAISDFIDWYWEDEQHELDDRTYRSVLTHMEEALTAAEHSLRE